MNTQRFTGKVALVTGGNSGIGLAVATALVREGARVVLVGRNVDTVAAAVKALGGAALGVAADMSKISEIEHAVAETKRFGEGRLDVVFANAGVAAFGPLAATTESQWDSMIDTNVKGVYFTVQKAVPLMQEGGAIVLNASVAASKGNASAGVYSASKAAVRSLGRTFAAELVAKGIRVNVVSPGPIETPIFGRTGASKEQADMIKAGMLERNPMKRFGTPEEVAQTVLFLMSGESSYITGVDLLVDGGLGSF